MAETLEKPGRRPFPIQRWTAAVLILCPVVAGLIVQGATGLLPFLGAAALGFGLLWLCAGLDRGPGSYLLTFVLVLQPILFTAVFTGHAWQADSHMLFFMVLAVVATLRSRGAVLFAVVLIASHHLSLTFLMPTLVYPGVDLLSNLALTAFHAVIVLAQAAVHLLVLARGAAKDRALAASKAEAVAAQASADRAAAAARTAQAEAEECFGRLAQGLSAMERGDLSQEISAPFPPAYDHARKDFNGLLRSLQVSLAAVGASAREFEDRALAVGQAMAALEVRTDDQVRRLDGVSGEISTIETSATGAVGAAHEARDFAEATRERASKSGGLMTDAVEAMLSLEQSTHEISTIIAVIQDISFQTNLLALNAGVEAARAGKSGLGFAVVASEVRALAQRTAEAADRVKSLIQASGAQVTTSADLVREAGSEITSVLEAMAENSDHAKGLAERSEQQAHRLGQIVGGIAELSDIVAQNAETVGQMGALRQSLMDEAAALSNALARFDGAPTGAALAEPRGWDGPSTEADTGNTAEAA